MTTAVSQPYIFEITSLVAKEHGSGKLALPVDRAALLYSRYKHVRGAPSIGSTAGVPLSKLRALDNLIERLIRLQGNHPIVKHTRELTEGEIDGLISAYRRDLHQTLGSPRRSLTVGSPANDLGLSLDIVA